MSPEHVALQAVIDELVRPMARAVDRPHRASRAGTGMNLSVSFTDLPVASSDAGVRYGDGAIGIFEQTVSSWVGSISRSSSLPRSSGGDLLLLSRETTQACVPGSLNPRAL